MFLRLSSLVVSVLFVFACSDADLPTAGPAAPVDRTGVWPVGDPAAHGFDAAALENAAQALWEYETANLLVVHAGEIVLERYWLESDADTSLPVFSVTKSFASTLVGVAEQQGLLDREDRAADFIPDWIGTDSETLTVRHLMAGDSGRYWDFAGDYPGSLGGGEPPADLTEYALARGQQFAPGTTWQYNQMAIQCLDRVLSGAAGVPTEQFAREQLFERLGMRGTLATTDEVGQMTLAYGMRSTARDLARFGLLYLQNGRWGDEQILSEDFARAATHPASGVNDNYGFLFWLNADGNWYEPVTLVYHETGKVYPSAPSDVFVASGFGGQLVLVSPSEDLIIVRQGFATPQGFARHYDEIYRTIVAARRGGESGSQGE